MTDKTYKPNQIPGLQQAANAASSYVVRNPVMDSETWNVLYYDDQIVEDPKAGQAIIDQAMKDPTKWVANNLNWGGIGYGGDFSALDGQIKFLKDNKYDISTLDKGALNQYNITKQILAQGTTGKWTGAGFGSPTENAKQMARVLSSAGIEDIKDFGKTKQPIFEEKIVKREMDEWSPTGRYYYEDPDSGQKTFVDPSKVRHESWSGPDSDYSQYVTTLQSGERDAYVNKKTGQAITQDYNGAYGNIFSGTYAGHGRTNYGVQFGPDGTPYFYTQFGGDTSSMADIAPILSILSIIPSPIQPFVAAANALISIDNGNVLGGLASLAGIPGIGEAVGAAGLAGVAEGIQTANKVVNLVNAIESGNIVGIVSSVAGAAGAGSTEIGDTGLTVSDAMKAANLVKAIGSDDPTAIFKAAVSFANSPTIKSSLDNPSTTITADGQKVADVIDKNFVDDLVNPDSQNYIGNANESLNDIIVNSPSTQLAATDDESAIRAIEELRSQKPDVEQQTSALDVLGQPLTEAAADITPKEEVTEPETGGLSSLPSDLEGQGESALDVLGEPLTEEAKDIEPVLDADPNLVAIGKGEQDAIDKAENVGDLGGLSSAEVGQGEQDAIDTATKTGDLEGLSSAEVGEGEQKAIDTIDQDQAIFDLKETEENSQTTTPSINIPNINIPNIPSVSGGNTNTNSSTTINNVTTSPTSRTTNAGGLAAFSIPWLDTSEDVLQGKSVQNQPTTLMASGGSTFGSELDNKLMPKFEDSGSGMLQTVASSKRSPLSMKALRHLQPNISPAGNMASGGLPKKYQEAAPAGHNTEFVTGLTGYYADGRGTGQSDDIPAMLHDGDYVMDAETVSALGDGSSKAGRQVLDGFRTQVPHSAKSGGSVVPAKIADGEYVFPESFVTALGQGDNKSGASILDGLREKLREHKRSAPLNKIPPKAKSPLDYIKKAKG
jgi:hypothetical protein